MEWIVIQLTSWAEKHMSTGELARELRRRTKTDDLELFYPSTEDVVGKHNSAYSEYLFVEYRAEVPYNELEGGDIFKAVLRNPDGKPSFLQDTEINEIRRKIELEQTLQPGDKVNIYQGPLKGTIGTVKSDVDGYVSLVVAMGDVDQEAVLSRKWVRRINRKKSSQRIPPPAGTQVSEEQPKTVEPLQQDAQPTNTPEPAASVAPEATPSAVGVQLTPEPASDGET